MNYVEFNFKIIEQMWNLFYWDNKRFTLYESLCILLPINILLIVNTW